jgi:hypothetical protein
MFVGYFACCTGKCELCHLLVSIRCQQLTPKLSPKIPRCIFGQKEGAIVGKASRVLLRGLLTKKEETI